jgi:hypothetical protein
MKHSVPMTHPVLARLGQVEWISRAINSSMGGDFDDGKTFIPPVLYKSVCIIHSKSVTSPPRMHVRPGREGFLCLPCSNVRGVSCRWFVRRTGQGVPVTMISVGLGKLNS